MPANWFNVLPFETPLARLLRANGKVVAPEAKPVRAEERRRSVSKHNSFSMESAGKAAAGNIVKDVPKIENMDDLKKELASLRLDDEPPRSRRGAWVIIALLGAAAAAGESLEEAAA